MTKTTTAVSLPTDPVTITPWNEGSIEGKVVALRPKYVVESLPGLLLYASGGFGCSLTTTGNAVFGLDDSGEQGRWERFMIAGIAIGPRADALAEVARAWEASWESQEVAFAAFAASRNFFLRQHQA